MTEMTSVGNDIAVDMKKVNSIVALDKKEEEAPMKFGINQGKH